MQLSWYGQSCFKIEMKNGRIVLDPFDRSAGDLEPPRSTGVDIAVFSSRPADAVLDKFRAVPSLVVGPGEYEARGVHFYGFPLPHLADGGKLFGFSTAFLIEGDDLRILHLGGLRAPALAESDLEEIGDVDILLVPVGGKRVLDGVEAAKIVGEVEPRVVIPMHYWIPELRMDLEGPEKFFRELGIAPPEKLSKLTVRRQDLSEQGMRAVLLEAVGPV